MEKRLILILGGARSGKSAYAQNLAARTSHSILYVATAQAGDNEMELRIAAHKKNRPDHWSTLEAFSKVGKEISVYDKEIDVVVIDCFTLLVNNVITSLPEPIDGDLADQLLNEELDDLLYSYHVGSSMWIIVSNEIGLGLVPPYHLGRIYRDVLGRAHQRLAHEADVVVFMVAGLPMVLKGDIP